MLDSSSSLLILGGGGCIPEAIPNPLSQMQALCDQPCLTVLRSRPVV